MTCLVPASYYYEKHFVHCFGVSLEDSVHNFFALPNSNSYPNIVEIKLHIEDKS